jgi:hypothetical protein
MLSAQAGDPLEEPPSRVSQDLRLTFSALCRPAGALRSSCALLDGLNLCRILALR